MSAFFLGAGGYALVSRMEAKIVLLLLGMAVMCLALLGWDAVLRFEFDGSGLRIVYPARTVIHAAAHLNGVALLQRELDIVVAIQFGSKTVELSDSQIVIAPERVFDGVVRGYHLLENAEGTTPRKGSS